MKRYNSNPSLVEFRDGNAPEIFGYGAVFYRDGDESTEFRLASNVRERIAPDAFRNIEDDVISAFNHDPGQILGRQSAGTLQVGTDERGLWYRIRFDAQDPDHARVRRKIEKRDVIGSSFAFAVRDESRERDGDNVIVTLRDVRLMELGPVTNPAYQGTTADARQERMALETFEPEVRRHVRVKNWLLKLDETARI